MGQQAEMQTCSVESSKTICMPHDLCRTSTVLYTNGLVGSRTGTEICTGAMRVHPALFMP